MAWPSTAAPQDHRRVARGTGSSSRGVAPARNLPPSRGGAAVWPRSGVRPPVLLSAPRISPSLARERRGSVVEVAGRRHRTVNHLQLAVLVNEHGHVVTARMKGGDTSQIGADRAALSAALAARFRPATRHGVPVKMWTVMTFDLPQ